MANLKKEFLLVEEQIKMNKVNQSN